MTILIEAYHGRRGNVLRAEKELDLVLKEMYDTYSFDSLSNLSKKAVSFDRNIHLEKCAKYLAKEFGFKEVKIFFSISETSGPMTIPSVFRFFNGKKSNGDIDFSNTTVYVYMSLTVNVQHRLTARETMAIILHEIGHSLDMTAPTKLKTLIQTIVTGGILPLLSALTNSILPPLTTMIDTIVSNSTIRKMLIQMDSAMVEMNQLLSPLKLGKLPLYIAYSFHQTLNGVHLGYYAERFSDSVAVTYGYGADLATALEKIAGKDKNLLVTDVINSNPITGLLFDFNHAVFTLIHVFYAPHPENIIRYRNALRKLEAELKDPAIPKDLKKEIQKDIIELNKVLTVLETPSFKRGNYNIFSALANRIVSGTKQRNSNFLDFLYKAEKYEM